LVKAISIIHFRFTLNKKKEISFCRDYTVWHHCIYDRL